MQRTIKIFSASEEDTKKAGLALSRILKPGDVVALFGDLGSGKTVFVKGIARGFSISEEVVSPTFNIMIEYEKDGLIFRHFDMYRISSEEALYDIGFFDSLSPPYISAVEWSENIKEFLPTDAIKVVFGKNGDNGREIEIFLPEGRE